MTEFPHARLDEADNVLKVADTRGVSLFVAQAAEFAPQSLRDDDTVILVLRGHEAVALGREAVTAVEKLLQAGLR